MQGNGSGHHRDTEAAFGTARHRGPDADRRLKQRLLLRQTDDSVPEDPRHLTARCVLRDRNRAPRGSAGAARPAEQANGPGLHHQRRSRHDLEEIAVSGQAGSR